MRIHITGFLNKNLKIYYDMYLNINHNIIYKNDYLCMRI